MAVQGHKDMLVTSSLDDVMLTSAFTGLPLCKLRLSIVAVGLDPDLAGARDDRHYERHQSGQTAQTLEGYLVRRIYRIGRHRYSER